MVGIRRDIFVVVGALLAGGGLASYIPSPTDPTKDLASFLYLISSVPKCLANTFIVIGIILIGVAFAYDRIVSIWNRVVDVWNFLRRWFSGSW